MLTTVRADGLEIVRGEEAGTHEFEESSFRLEQQKVKHI